MKSSLTIIKIVLTVASIVSIGTALGATIYFGVLKNTPPVVVQPTIIPTITQILPPTVTQTSTPIVTPDNDTADWKTYKNEKYGFEFKYPKNLSLEEKTDSVFKSFSVFLKNDDLNGYILINNPGVGTGFDIAISSENILIDGINSKLQILDSSSDNERAGIVSFNKNNNNFFWLFRFDKSDANKLALVKKTFSTFKFTEIDNTVDWKTYRNEKYGFEFKYPQNWWIGEEKPNWQGNVNESYDPYLIVMLNASGIPNDFMVPILCKENITYENFLKFYENSNHKISTIKDIIFKGVESKLVSNYNVSVKKESHIVVLQFKNKMKCSLFQPTVDDSDYPVDHKYNLTINQILSTFKFTEK